MDQLLISTGHMTLTTDEGQKTQLPENELSEMMRTEFQAPIHGEALPDGVKFIEWKPPFLCVVHQLPPLVRQARWIADNSPVPFGPGTKFKTRRLSMPYAVTFAVYCKHGPYLSLIGYNELYFRNEPLKSREDTLGYPALLNVSRIDIKGRSRSWICTQYLECPAQAPWTVQLASLLDHTWNGAFNRSSEHHEGASWYGESIGIHKDLHPVSKWEKASKKNDSFSLGIPWKPVQHNVGQLIDAMLSECSGDVHARRLSRVRGTSKSSIVARLMNYLQQEKNTSIGTGTNK
jgi:hypothetical protein